VVRSQNASADSGQSTATGFAAQAGQGLLHDVQVNVRSTGADTEA
jgi:hypothetical protein